jgi:trans-2,3-dihydro-3-hydroxyanthranilate isomerase
VSITAGDPRPGRPAETGDPGRYNPGVPTLRYVTCDVFTDTPLTGNQLAVFTDARGLSDALMQALALEIGYSETVFVVSPEQGGHARIRIFTPAFELPFAGHPVLGTAFVLGAPLQLGVIELETGRGAVAVVLERAESGRITFGRMQQPVPTVEPFAGAEALFAALGVEGSEAPVELYDNGARHLLVVLPSAGDVASLAPDGAALAALDVTGVSCLARDGEGWKTRMFWVRGEDAATGSAAGPIACHLARHGLIGWGEEIVISQGVEIGRPSVLYARADGGAGLIDAVEVGGSAVVVARGEYRLP